MKENELAERVTAIIGSCAVPSGAAKLAYYM